MNSFTLTSYKIAFVARYTCIVWMGYENKGLPDDGLTTFGDFNSLQHGHLNPGLIVSNLVRCRAGYFPGLDRSRRFCILSILSSAVHHPGVCVETCLVVWSMAFLTTFLYSSQR